MNPTLRNKIGQLFMVGFDGLEINHHIAQLIEQQKVGGIILFRRNVQTPKQVAKLCRNLQAINAQANESPLLIALDQEGGMVMRIEQGVTPMPSAMAFQAAGSEQDCEQLHRISADEMCQIGINMMLAPVLDVNNNRANPVIGVRAFGESPDTVIRYGMAALRGLQSAGVITTAKHFPGHGDTSTDSHVTMPLVPHDRARLNAIELAPFKAAIAQGVDAMMTAHVVFPAIEPQPDLPATLSKTVLTDLLRGELKFNGVIISDCLEMAAIADGVGTGQAAVRSLQAGADMMLISHRQASQEAAIDAVVVAVELGLISGERIDQSYQRIQQLKKIKAVVEWRSAFTAPATLMAPASLALAKKVQQAALRVQGNFRALNRDLPVALITVEMCVRSEIDELASGKVQQQRSSMLPALLNAGMNVREFVLFVQASESEIAAAIQFAQHAPQIILQSYNAVLDPAQKQVLAALPPQKLWLIAGRLPYDLDLVPDAQGRLACYACRPFSLTPAIEKMLGA